MILLRLYVICLLLVQIVSVGYANGGENPENMSRTNTEDFFSETVTTDDRFTYIDALVTLRKDPIEGEKKIEPLKFRQEIVRTFCDTVLQQRTGQNIAMPSLESTWYFDHQGYRYDPRQSMMMYAICVPFDERRKPLDEQESYTLGPGIHRNYKEKVFGVRVEYPTGPKNAYEGTFVMNNHWQDKEDNEALTRMRGTIGGSNPFLSDEENENQPPQPCDPITDMNRCAFSSWLPGLYQNIMDELVTMRQASVYGYRYYDTEAEKAEQEVALDEAVHDFTFKYFMEGTDGVVTCRDTSLHYLNAGEVAVASGGSETSTVDTFVEGDKKHCYHPQTEKLVRDTIRDQHTLLESLEYLDPSTFFSSDNVCSHKKPLLTNHWCALSSYQNSAPGSNDSQSFHNVLLNELMRYNLFTTYYLNNITTNNSLSRDVGIVSALGKARDEVSIFTYEQQLAGQAITTTMRMLNNVQSTYPIHIGLQAYLEDIKGYRKQLSAVYTPMHQLSYLLRNVQECS